MPVAERLELLEVNRIGQLLRGLVGFLRVTHTAQRVNNPLPSLCHDTTMPPDVRRCCHQQA